MERREAWCWCQSCGGRLSRVMLPAPPWMIARGLWEGLKGIIACSFVSPQGKVPSRRSAPALHLNIERPLAEILASDHFVLVYDFANCSSTGRVVKNENKGCPGSERAKKGRQSDVMGVLAMDKNSTLHTLPLDDNIAPDEGPTSGQVAKTLPAEDQRQQARAPGLLHRFRHHNSILCLATSDDRIFAGTQAGELLVGLKVHSQSHGDLTLTIGIHARHLSA